MTRIAISKWGNSTAIRLPKAVVEELGLKLGEVVELTVQDGKGVIAPIQEPVKAVTLGWIISEMQRLGAANEPETVDWGPDRGEEVINDDYSRRR